MGGGAMDYGTEISDGESLGSEDTEYSVNDLDSDESFVVASETDHDVNLPFLPLKEDSRAGADRSNMDVDPKLSTVLNSIQSLIDDSDCESNDDGDMQNKARKKSMRDSAKPVRKRMRKLTKRYEPHLRTKCSLTKMSKISKNLKDKTNLKLVIHSMGFAPMLKISYIQLPRELLRILVDNFDPYRSVIEDHQGLEVVIKKEDIAEALGLGYTGEKVPLSASPEAMKEVADNIPELALGQVEQEFEGYEKDDTKFRQLFLMYILGRYLCPFTNDAASPAHYPAVTVANNAHLYDWSEYTYNWLIMCAKNYKEKKQDGHGGCLAALLAVYLNKVKDQEGMVKNPEMEKGNGLICGWSSDALYARARQEIERLTDKKLIKDDNDERKRKESPTQNDEAVSKKLNGGLPTKTEMLVNYGNSLDGVRRLSISDTTTSVIIKSSFSHLQARYGKSPTVIYITSSDDECELKEPRMVDKSKCQVELIDLDTPVTSLNAKVRHDEGSGRDVSVVPIETCDSITDDFFCTPEMEKVWIDIENGKYNKGKFSKAVNDIPAVKLFSTNDNGEGDTQMEPNSEGHKDKRPRRLKLAGLKICSPYVDRSYKVQYKEYADKEFLESLMAVMDKATNLRKELIICGRIWGYIVGRGDAKRNNDVVVDVYYYNHKLTCEDIRNSLMSNMVIDTKIVDLHAVRLMRGWMTKLNGETHMPRFIIKSSFIDHIMRNYFEKGETIDLNKYMIYFARKNLNNNYLIRGSNMVLFPMKMKDHWFLIVFNFRDRRIDVLDSEYKTLSGKRAEYVAAMTNIMQKICDITGKNVNLLSFGNPRLMDTPKYRNSHSSGVFTMHYCGEWDGSLNKVYFTENDIEPFKRRLLCDWIVDRTNKCHKTILENARLPVGKLNLQ